MCKSCAGNPNKYLLDCALNRERLEKEKVERLERRIQLYEEQVKSLNLVISGLKSIIADKEACVFEDYKSHKEGYEGYLEYFEDKDCYGLYIKYYEGRDNIYEDITVYGSWDNYERSYDLYQLLKDKGDNLSKHNSSVYFIILDDHIPYGKYTYKFKKGDQWIEPSENELKEKDKHGNYNNVLFVHA